MTEAKKRAIELVVRSQMVVRSKSLATAKRLHRKAKDEGDPVKYEQAAIYFEAAGWNYQACICRMTADTLRR